MGPASLIMGALSLRGSCQEASFTPKPAGSCLDVSVEATSAPTHHLTPKNLPPQGRRRTSTAEAVSSPTRDQDGDVRLKVFKMLGRPYPVVVENTVEYGEIIWVNYIETYFS